MGRVELHETGRVAHVTLSNPGKFNAMSRSMWRELRHVFESFSQDAATRCVLISGESGHFCAGGDISEYAGFRFEEALLRDFHEGDVWGGLQAVLDCDVPIVAQIEGNCMGAGLEIASCCDVRLAAASARFGAPIAKLGFPMAPREAALVLSAVGELTAREMLLTASVLDAQEMKLRGFLNSVVPDADISLATQSSVARICKLVPAAARLNKQTLRALGHKVRVQPAIEFIAKAYQYANTPEHREGVQAFVEKRSPNFL